jgi:hypothetical protein
MLGKSITGISFVKFLHHAVSGNLGYDRGTGNGKTDFVTSGYPSLGYGALRQTYSVNEQEVWLFGQPFHRLHHSHSGCLQDINGINNLRGSDADTYGNSLLIDQVKKRFTLSGV